MASSVAPADAAAVASADGSATPSSRAVAAVTAAAVPSTLGLNGDDSVVKLEVGSAAGVGDGAAASSESKQLPLSSPSDGGLVIEAVPADGTGGAGGGGGGGDGAGAPKMAGIVLTRFHVEAFASSLFGILEGNARLLDDGGLFFTKAVLHAATVALTALALAGICFPVVVFHNWHHNLFSDKLESTGANTTVERRTLGPPEMFDPQEAFFWKWTLGYGATGITCILSIVVGLVFTVSGRWRDAFMWKTTVMTVLSWMGYTVLAYLVVVWTGTTYERLLFLGPAFTGTILGGVYVAWVVRAQVGLGHKVLVTMLIQLCTLGGVLYLYAETIPRWFLKTDDELLKAVIRLTVHPLAFEIANAATRIAVAVYPPATRDKLVVFLFTPYFMNALLGRFLVASMSNVTSSVIVAVCLIALESAMRSTAASRDLWLARKIYGPARADLLWKSRTIHRVMADIMSLDALAENFGILLAPVIVYYYHIQLERDAVPLVVSAGIQMALEALTNIAVAVLVLAMHREHEIQMVKLGLPPKTPRNWAMKFVVHRKRLNFTRHASLEHDKHEGPAHGELESRPHMMTSRDKHRALMHSASADAYADTGDRAHDSSSSDDDVETRVDTAGARVGRAGFAASARLTIPDGPLPGAIESPAKPPHQANGGAAAAAAAAAVTATAAAVTNGLAGAGGSGAGVAPAAHTADEARAMLAKHRRAGVDADSEGALVLHGQAKEYLAPRHHPLLGNDTMVSQRGLVIPDGGADAGLGARGGGARAADANSRVGPKAPSKVQAAAGASVTPGGDEETGDAADVVDLAPLHLHPLVALDSATTTGSPRGTGTPSTTPQSAHPDSAAVASGAGGAGSKPGSGLLGRLRPGASNGRNGNGGTRGKGGTRGSHGGSSRRAGKRADLAVVVSDTGTGSARPHLVRLTSAARKSGDAVDIFKALLQAAHKRRGSRSGDSAASWMKVVALHGISNLKASKVNAINAWEHRFNGHLFVAAFFAVGWTSYFALTFFYPGVIICTSRMPDGLWRYDTCL